MSDHDRGAYTPPNDEPLSFDARQSRGGRRAFPTTLIISLVILFGLGGAIFMFYRSGVRGAGEAPTPVGAPVGEIKAPAPASSANPDVSAGLQIYKTEGAPAAPAGAPVFAAGPEQPAPRPAPTTPVAVAQAPPVTAAPATTASAVAASGATTKAVAVPAPAPLTAKAPPAAATVAAKPAPAPAAAKPVQLAQAAPPPVAPAAAAVPAAANPARGAAVVQIGAYYSAALAGKGWSDIAAAYGADMAGKGKLVEAVERDGKTLYRGAVSGFASHDAAVAFCAKLKADNRACIVR